MTVHTGRIGLEEGKVLAIHCRMGNVKFVAKDKGEQLLPTALATVR